VLVVRSRALLAVFGVRVIMRLGARIVGPVLPLFIQTLLPVGARVASVSGLISGVSAIASAIAAVVLGRFGDRLGYRRVLLACAMGAALFYVPQFFVTTPTQLLVFQAGVGLAMGGTLAMVSAMLAALAPEGRQGAVYGVDASVVSAANAVGPMLGASLAAGLGLRSVFLCAAAVFGLAALVVAGLVPRRGQSGHPQRDSSAIRFSENRPDLMLDLRGLGDIGGLLRAQVTVHSLTALLPHDHAILQVDGAIR